MSNLNRVMARIDGAYEAAMWRDEKIARLSKKIEDEFVLLFMRINQSDAVRARRKTLIARLRRVMPDHPFAR